jgi:Ca-activated chloride channel family protein
MKIRPESDFTVELLMGLLMSIMAGFLVSMLLALLVMFLPGLSQAAVAADTGDQEMIGKNDVTSGSILLRTEKQGQYRLAPILKTDVHMRVNGMLVRTRVVQRFKNPGQDWLEGIYVFPLPDKAAVDHLRMRIGDRIIVGKIKERQEAKKIYTQAKQSGHKASLIEQERANIFTTSIANIGPDEMISIEIEYQQTLHLDKDRLRLRFPLVVAPRYIPGSSLDIEEQVKGFSGSGWAQNTDQVTDAERITPPVVHPRQGKLNPVTLRVELNAGFSIDDIQSTYHRINREVQSATRMILTLQDKQVPADRDFELVWKPHGGHLPNAALFSEGKGEENYLMLMIMPPDAEQTSHQVLDREVIYVIDTSGSMGGTSIRQARRALQYAIKDLNPGDYFNVIQFNSVTSRLYEQSVPADQVHKDEALQYVQSLNASGGTEMATALRAALERVSETGRLRQVVFLTDGSIGNEDALFRIIKDKLADSRLFTVGIGSAPNSHFMHKAAQFGRGTYTYIGKIDEVDEKMSALFRKIQMPVLSNLEVHWPENTKVEMWPERLPDLYAGEPIILTAKLPVHQGTVTIKGQRLQQNWQISVPLDKEQQSQGIAVLWAREKIAHLMDRLREGVSADVIKKGVTDLALEHHLVSRYTSLVAVDVTPARTPAEKFVTKATNVNLPAGWQHEKVFASLPQTAAGSYRDLLLGMLLTLLGCLLSLYFHRKNTYVS